MYAELEISQVYYNKGLSNFFMRSQALNTLEELHDKFDDEIFDAIEEYYDNIDDAEEDLYSLSAYEFAFNVGLESEDEEEDEE